MDQLEIILAQLMLNPNHFYVNPEGTQIVAYEPESQQVLIIDGEGYDKATYEELNQTIQDALLALMSNRI